MHSQPIKSIAQKHGGFPSGVFPTTTFWKKYGYKRSCDISESGKRNFDDALRTSITPKSLGDPAVECAIRIRRDVRAGNWGALQEYYVGEAEATRSVIRHSLGEKNAAVILADSGTGATTMIFHLLGPKHGDRVLTTRSCGMLNPQVFEGKDPNSLNELFLSTPNVGLFSKPEKAENVNLDVKTVHIELYTPDMRSIPDSGIIKEARSRILDEKIRLFVFPFVSREGRLMPFKEIAGIVREENRRRAKLGLERVWLALDAVQAIGKTDFELLRKPLSNCDFIFFSSCKGLGGLPISSAFVARNETIEKLLPNLMNSPFSAHVRHLSFPEEFERKLKLVVERNGIVISLPEVVSFRAAIKGFFGPNAKIPDDMFLSLSDGQMAENVSMHLAYPSHLASRLRCAIEELSMKKAIRPIWDEHGVRFPASVVTFYIESPRAYDVRAKMIQDHGVVVGFVQKDESVAPKQSDGVIRTAFPAYREPPNSEELIPLLDRYVAGVSFALAKAQ
ncbi:MAG: hypothetical protein NT157_00015 [Candidatus Micrarchaeota archaeon]|nr:hypothetical protein [Candidatus Micrarchaeota archaeon]